MMQTLLMNWKIVVIVALFSALGTMSTLYVHKRDELIFFRAQVAQAGKAQQIENAEIKAAYAENLIQIRSDHESKIPQIRNNSVAAYRAQRLLNDDADRRPMPGPSASLRLDDGAGQKCIPDERLIADAADDAAKLEAFQSWCRLNKCPVVE